VDNIFLSIPIIVVAVIAVFALVSAIWILPEYERV